MAAHGLSAVGRQGDDRILTVGLFEIAVVDALTDHIANFGQGKIPEHAKGGIMLKAVAANFSVLTPFQDIGHHSQAEAPFQFIDAEADAADLFGHILFNRFLVAVAAFIAVFPRRMFAKIRQDIMAQAVIAFTVADHGMEQAEFDLLLFYVADGLFNEEFLDHDILPVKEEDTVSRRPVAAGAARFLVVAFDVLRHLVMDDVADVALVDAHPKALVATMTCILS